MIRFPTKHLAVIVGTIALCGLAVQVHAGPKSTAKTATAKTVSARTKAKNNYPAMRSRAHRRDLQSRTRPVTPRYNRASKADQTVEGMARATRNQIPPSRVTIRTSGGQIRHYDLTGKAHGPVNTPHVKIQHRRMKTRTEPMTKADVRTVRRFLNRQKKERNID